MFASERRQSILDALTRDGRVEVGLLAAALAVSEDTVRRDLKALADQGFLQKTHGGAVSLAITQMTYPVRAGVRRAAKASIGAAAARLVEPHQTLFVDAGGTTLELVRALDVAPLRVITNSLDVALALSERAGVELIVCGGRWVPGERHLAGAAALAQVEAHRADLAFIGACALHSRLGVSSTEESDARLKAAMLARAARGILLADETKFEQVAPHFVAPLADFDSIVTDCCPAWLPAQYPALRVIEAEPGSAA
ncbi:DeoR/GlpR family DNA-binding transcription regulator [Chitinimonas koreensis]|uniref:DeoR/GlpR family DNA-binding transcription regulator n=1 Tax=Chitinimonas koreensis TaxID=356302 RepID=UPI00040F9881|nr:DeoR/GlpR family DNA-binding transcription regulator [Chitinimonas koreensis]QNM96018.1 DeoR/GlpR transcriptional regulator [Chitinimonas koreensis]